ncbi:hypothetical protein WG66_000201, partial [Moniliophthora roreri]
MVKRSQEFLSCTTQKIARSPDRGAKVVHCQPTDMSSVCCPRPSPRLLDSGFPVRTARHTETRSTTYNRRVARDGVLQTRVRPWLGFYTRQ